MTYFHSAMYDVRWRTVTRTLFESLHRLPKIDVSIRICSRCNDFFCKGYDNKLQQLDRLKNWPTTTLLSTIQIIVDKRTDWQIFWMNKPKKFSVFFPIDVLQLMRNWTLLRNSSFVFRNCQCRPYHLLTCTIDRILQIQARIHTSFHCFTEIGQIFTKLISVKWFWQPVNKILSEWPPEACFFFW